MRSTFVAIAIVAAALPAAAQPVVTTRPCEVRFVLAPEDVRHVIETWLQAEPRCSNTIDVRVIATDDGYYVMGQRPDGRIHERVVPDAQSAGVLVASWAADDWVAQREEVTPPPHVPVHPVAAAPGDSLAVTAQPAPRRRGPSKWLSAGLMRNPEDGRDDGLRAEVDLIARGNWGLGAALVYAEGTLPVYSGASYGSIHSRDVSVLAYGSYTLGRNRWQLRFALGVGAGEGELDGELSTSGGAWQYIHASGRATFSESSALITRRLGNAWGITVGPMLTTVHQRSTTDDGMSVVRSDGQFRVFAGLRRQL